MANNGTSVGYYAPGFKIEINGSELDPQAAHAILSVKVEQELNKTNSFTLEVQDEYRDGHFHWLETGLFQVGNPVSIALGYTDRVVNVLHGKVQNLNASFHLGSAPTFTVEGTDASYDLLTAPSEAHVFREKRDSDIVREIARDIAHLQAVVDETKVITPVKTKQGGKSYLEFLTTLASDNHFEFFLGGRRLYFRASSYQESAANLTWGKDLIRFEPQLNTTAAVTEVVVRGWDASGKKLIEGRARAGEESTHESEKRTSSELMRSLFGEVVKVITDRPVRSQEEARTIAVSELNNASNNLIQATIETIGQPQLTPGVCVGVAGFGKLFSGKYYVVKATHSFGAEGYRTSLTARRNAL
ncbi:MAG TPA: hypothetical protein VK961_13020 [Chthoniobacter sp.]|nr:hypothetical protein [Chthoniobacter sp.]